VKRFRGDYSLNLYCYRLYEWECDNDNGKYYKYVCITTNQPDTKSNPNPNVDPNHGSNPITEQHTIVSIQLNIVTYFCVLFSSMVTLLVRVRVSVGAKIGIRFSVWLVSGYAHVFVITTTPDQSLLKMRVHNY